VAILIVWAQRGLLSFDNLRAISISLYSNTDVVLLGMLFGAGALLGDATKSYFKRRRQIPSGEKWWPFDQIDFILGSTIFVSFAFWPGWKVLIAALILTMFLHPAINKIGYRLGLKKVPW
jgi:CDP-2,3-bis-(O-geranylgeranyl)-sn-glycerol synthase